jgi:hypothetical protein
MPQTRRRLARAFVATVLLAAALPAAAQKGTWDVVSTNATHPALAVSSDDTINPLRGYYRWRDQEVVPQPEPARDDYQRYQWRDLEPADGVYDFSALLADRDAARDTGRKFAFRLRMMAGYDDDTVYMPAWLANHAACLAGCGFWADADAADPGLTWVPDWNDPFVQARARALLQALAAALGGDADLAWIDVGLYGQYGEWALRSSAYAAPPPGITAATDASKREFARMHFDAFPTAQHVMFALYSNRDALAYGLLEQAITARPVGLRVDCLSRYGFFDQWSNHPADWAAFANQWQRAPFVGEFCNFERGHPTDNPATARQQAAAYHVSTIGNGNFATSRPDAERWGSLTPAEQADLLMLGREIGYRLAVASSAVTLNKSGGLSLTATFANHGNAPAYEPWTVRAELLNAQGMVKWSATLPATLGNLAGGGSTQAMAKQAWALPSSLAAGTYKLRVVARDPRQASNPLYYRPMLKWVDAQRDADGGLAVATLRKR